MFILKYNLEEMQKVNFFFYKLLKYNTYHNYGKLFRFNLAVLRDSLYLLINIINSLQCDQGEKHAIGCLVDALTNITPSFALCLVFKILYIINHILHTNRAQAIPVVLLAIFILYQLSAMNGKKSKMTAIRTSGLYIRCHTDLS